MRRALKCICYDQTCHCVGLVKKRPRIGAHTSIAGSLERAADKAFELDCEAFQIFSCNSRMWQVSKLDTERHRRKSEGF